MDDSEEGEGREGRRGWEDTNLYLLTRLSRLRWKKLQGSQSHCQEGYRSETYRGIDTAFGADYNSEELRGRGNQADVTGTYLTSLYINTVSLALRRGGLGSKLLRGTLNVSDLGAQPM